MAEIINFPTNSIKSEKEFKELLKNINLPQEVNMEKWEKIAIPNIYKLFDLPIFDKSFNVGEMKEHEITSFKNELSESIKEYGQAVQAPLIMEITKLSSRGQIVIPQKIRNELKIDEG